MHRIWEITIWISQSWFRSPCMWNHIKSDYSKTAHQKTQTKNPHFWLVTLWVLIRKSTASSVHTSTFWASNHSGNFVGFFTTLSYGLQMFVFPILDTSPFFVDFSSWNCPLSFCIVVFYIVWKNETPFLLFLDYFIGKLQYSRVLLHNTKN